MKGSNAKRRRKQPKAAWTAWQEATVNSPHPDPMEKTRTTWLNSRYQVERHDLPNGITYLSIKRLHKQAIHDWRELLRIKNELTHPMREGIELYPSMARIQDTSNQFHMFVMPLGCAINLGYTDRHVEDGFPDEFEYGRARQRKLPAWMTPWRKSQESVTAPFAVGMGSDGKGGIELLFPWLDHADFPDEALWRDPSSETNQPEG